MTDYSRSSTNLRREPKQQRGRQRVEKILKAAAVLFDELGYEATTTHLIAAKAGTAIGSLYQFFPDKAAIFYAMELRHTERVAAMFADLSNSDIGELPLADMIAAMVDRTAELFAHPVSRVIFVQFYTARELFQAIDERMTQGVINFLANLLRQRNPQLPVDQSALLAEVCVHSSNAVLLVALRQADESYRQQLIQQIPDLLTAYLMPYVGDSSIANVMKVMKCPHCTSSQLQKNGWRRGKQCYRCKDCGKQFVNPQAVPKIKVAIAHSTQQP